MGTTQVSMPRGANSELFTIYNSYMWRQGAESINENSPCCIPNGCSVMADNQADSITFPSGVKYYCLSCGTSYQGAISGGDYSSYIKNNAFDDGRNSSYWVSAQAGSSVPGVAYIGNDFGSGNTRHVRCIRMVNYPNIPNNINSVKVQYSDNGSSWTDEGTHAVSGASGAINYIELASTGQHRYWRILANATPAGGEGNYWALYQVQMSEWPSFGLDTGSWATGTWYHLWLIKNPNTNAVRHLWSASSTSPTMPTGYTVKKLVSAGRYSTGPAIVNWWQQYGRKVMYSALMGVASGSPASWTAINLSSAVPPNICTSVVAYVSSSYSAYTSNWASLCVGGDGMNILLRATSWYWSSNGYVGLGACQGDIPLVCDRAIPSIWYSYQGVTGGGGGISIAGFVLE